MRRPWLAFLLAIVWLAACGKGGNGDGAAGTEPESASGASSIAQAAIDRWTKNAEGVSGYTVTLTVDGTEQTETFVKETVDGLPVFVPEGSDASRESMAQFPQLLSIAREQGSGNVDGTATHILVVDDPAALTRVFASEGGAFQPVRMEIELGKDDLLMRRIKIVGTATMPGGESREVTNIVQLEDWRTVDGFAYPYRTTTRVEGLSDMVAASSGEIDAAAAEAERQIAQLPEAQREAARQAMGSRIAAARQAASGQPLESVMEVQDLQVRH